jgi:hypothetical protein
MTMSESGAPSRHAASKQPKPDVPLLDGSGHPSLPLLEAQA